MRSAEELRQGRSRGLSLIEVTISIALVTTIILGAMMVRYYAVRHAVRADAYNTAGRIGQVFLEGWRTTTLNTYEPYDSLTGQLSISPAGSDGPDVTADGFTTYTSPGGNTHYYILLHGRHYYVTLGYIAPVTSPAGSERPAVIHAAVAFCGNYGTWSASAGISTVRLSTNR